jgi:predicted lipoprotein with Yx(FWY)xxD motif
MHRTFVVMQHKSLATFGLAGIMFVTGCSGGGGGSSSYMAPGATRSTASPTSAPAGSSVLQTANIDGAPTFVTSSDLPVYTFDGDTADKSNCTGGCLAAWPSVPPPAGALSAPWSSFTRSDNGQKQLAYNGAPLYTFTGDSPGVSTGNGTEGFSLARPLASVTPAPTATPSAVPAGSPTPAPTPTATAVPTATPHATATPSGAPTATPTPRATNYPY